MEALSTIMPFKLEIVGSYECPECKTTVNIVKSVRNGKELISKMCLECDNRKLKKECEDLLANKDLRKAQSLFNVFSIVTSDVTEANFENYDPKNEDQRKAKNGAIWYAKNFPNLDKDFHSMLFQGSYGLGKSHLAHAISNQVKDKGKTSIFINVPELLNMIRGTFNRNSKFTENELLDAISKVELLVLDDIGAEYVKNDSDGTESWATDKLFQIINSRVAKPTIYTTNYNSGDLAKKYGKHGGRIVSRMMQGTKVIKFSGDDFRLKGF